MQHHCKVLTVATIHTGDWGYSNSLNACSQTFHYLNAGVHHKLTNYMTPQHADSSPYLQEPATGPYPEPTGSTLHPQPISLRSVLSPEM
jgi:hypothetical protein